MTKLGPITVKYIPNDVTTKKVELSLTYKGKPEHVWVGLKLFKGARDVLQPKVIDTSDPFNTEFEDIKHVDQRALQENDIIYVTTNDEFEVTNPTDSKTGEPIMRNGILVEKRCLNLNYASEIQIVSEGAPAPTQTPDSIPLAV